MEELACKAHFTGKSQFGDLVYGTFQSHFEASNGIFGGQNFTDIAYSPLMLFYTSRPYQRFENRLNQTSYAKVMPPAVPITHACD
jgi:hypothetical protein